MVDTEDHNRHIEPIKTLKDSGHEDDQANNDALALIEELCCLDVKEERLKGEKNEGIVCLQELIERNKDP